MHIFNALTYLASKQKKNLCVSLDSNQTHFYVAVESPFTFLSMSGGLCIKPIGGGGEKSKVKTPAGL